MLSLHILQGQIDGCVVRVRFTLTQRQKASSPPKVMPAAPKREVPPRDKVGTIAEKDAPQRPRERKYLELTRLSFLAPLENFLLHKFSLFYCDNLSHSNIYIQMITVA